MEKSVQLVLLALSGALSAVTACPPCRPRMGDPPTSAVAEPATQPDVQPAALGEDQPYAERLEEYAPSNPSEVHAWIKSSSNAAEAKAWLVDHPESLTQRDDKGLTALHWAARLGRTELVRLLLAHHADVDARSTSGRQKHETPLAFLMDTLRRPLGPNPTAEEVNEVRQSMSRGFMESDRPLPPQYTEIAKMLIVAGANLNARDDIGQTPVMKAVIGGHRDILAALLDANPDLEARTRFGQCVFEIAKASSARPEVVRMLKDAQHRQAASRRASENPGK